MPVTVILEGPLHPADAKTTASNPLHTRTRIPPDTVCLFSIDLNAQLLTVGARIAPSCTRLLYHTRGVEFNVMMI